MIPGTKIKGPDMSAPQRVSQVQYRSSFFPRIAEGFRYVMFFSLIGLLAEAYIKHRNSLTVTLNTMCPNTSLSVNPFSTAVVPASSITPVLSASANPAVSAVPTIEPSAVGPKGTSTIIVPWTGKTPPLPTSSPTGIRYVP